jgi:hypothetical protein
MKTKTRWLAIGVPPVQRASLAGVLEKKPRPASFFDNAGRSYLQLSNNWGVCKAAASILADGRSGCFEAEKRGRGGRKTFTGTSPGYWHRER